MSRSCGPGFALALEVWAWPAGTPKEVWARRAWPWLHGTAARYACRPTPGEARETLGRILHFLRSLPCPECRAHALAYVAARPPALAGGPALGRWTWAFHNAVNARLGLPPLGFPEYLARWAGRCGCWRGPWPARG